MSLLLGSLNPALLPPCSAHVVAAIALGSGMHGVELYAACLGVSVRSAQLTLQRAKLPNPQRLLAWGRAIWLAWRLARLDFTLKRAAAEGGFSGTQAMSRALRPLIRCRLRDLFELAAPERLVSQLLREAVGDRN